MCVLYNEKVMPVFVFISTLYTHIRGGREPVSSAFFLFPLFFFLFVINIIQHFHFPRIDPVKKKQESYMHIYLPRIMGNGELGDSLPPIQEQKHTDEENSHLINSRMEKMRRVARDFISSLISMDRLYTCV